MNDPERLSRGGDFQASLLASARTDGPRRTARRRAALAMGLSAALTAEGLAGAATVAGAPLGKAMITLSVTKLVGLGVLVFGLGGAVVAVSHRRHVSVTAPANLHERAPVAQLDVPPPEPVAPVAPTALVVAALPAAKPRAEESLASQLALLAEARHALARSDLAAASKALARYRKAHPSGPLQAEADLLRVELLVARGERSAAMSLAQRLLDDAPSGPHARRLRSLITTLE